MPITKVPAPRTAPKKAVKPVADPVKAPKKTPETPKKKAKKSTKPSTLPAMNSLFAAMALSSAPKGDLGVLRSFGDSQPTRGKKELILSITDWFDFAAPTEGENLAIFSYGFNVAQSLFLSVASAGGSNETRLKILNVMLKVLTPPGPVASTDLGGTTTEISLFSFLATVVAKNAEGEDLSLLGQTQTVIHPDVRQPWVTIGNWNWRSMWKNSQMEPHFIPAGSGVSQGSLDLFRFAILDATSGVPFRTADPALKFRFQVELTIAAPLPLAPAPLRELGGHTEFTQQAGTYAPDSTPVQYVLKTLANEN